MKTQLMIALIFSIGMTIGLTSHAQTTGDKKAQAVESTDEFVASFVPKKRAELDAKKAMKLKKESMAIAGTSKLAPMKNPEGKPNRMFKANDDGHRGGNGRTGKAGRSRLR